MIARIWRGAVQRREADAYAKYMAGTGVPAAIVSTGSTLIQTIVRLREAGAEPPVCIAVHGVFAGDAELWLRTAGAAGVVTTNTIEHSTNAIDVVPALLPAVTRFLCSR